MSVMVSWVFVLKEMLLGLKTDVVHYWEIKCFESHGRKTS